MAPTPGPGSWDSDWWRCEGSSRVFFVRELKCVTDTAKSGAGVCSQAGVYSGAGVCSGAGVYSGPCPKDDKLILCPCVVE